MSDIVLTPAMTMVEKKLGYAFKDKGILIHALTHSSYTNEAEGCIESNERLEFLGDAVLELAVTDELYRRYPGAQEGQLTRIRARLVKEPTLASIARNIGLQEAMLLGKGEEAQGGRERDSLLADGVEALLGAIYLDGAFQDAVHCIMLLWEGLWPESADIPKSKDYKTLLQEFMQRDYKKRPVYLQTGTNGPDHAKVYEVRVDLPDGSVFQASGSSKKKAEQSAARQALEALKYTH